MVPSYTFVGAAFISSPVTVNSFLAIFTVTCLVLVKFVSKSVHLTWILISPFVAAFGVPEITPVSDIVSPAGKLPLTISNLTLGVSLEAAFEGTKVTSFIAVP